MKTISVKPRRDSYRARRAVRIALDTRNRWPNYIPRVEATRLLAPDGISIHTFRTARNFVELASKELIDAVLADEISLYKAYEQLTKGKRIICLACEGRGYTFK
jgi:hypothetical protein